MYCWALCALAPVLDACAKSRTATAGKHIASTLADQLERSSVQRWLCFPRTRRSDFDIWRRGDSSPRLVAENLGANVIGDPWSRPPTVSGLSEQIRMRSRADEVQVVTIELVDRQPIRLDTSVALVLPVASERVVLAPWRQGTPLDRQQDHFAQLRHVLAAFLCEFHIAPKLRFAYRVSHCIGFPGP